MSDDNADTIRGEVLPILSAFHQGEAARTLLHASAEAEEALRAQIGPIVASAIANALWTGRPRSAR